MQDGLEQVEFLMLALFTCWPGNIDIPFWNVVSCKVETNDARLT